MSSKYLRKLPCAGALDSLWLMDDRSGDTNPALRLTGSTRSEILRLLRQEDRTVQELAAALGITGNAVRGHLHALGREHLVVRQGVRRDTGGKPAHLYGLTADAERLFPKAYAAILDRLLDAVDRRLGSEELERLLRQIGREVARDLSSADGAPLPERVRAAAAVLDGLGGATRVEDGPEAYVIRGNGCPLGTLVTGHPELCRMAETMVAAITGADVRERCDRGADPSCAFEVLKR